MQKCVIEEDGVGGRAVLGRSQGLEVVFCSSMMEVEGVRNGSVGLERG